MNAALPWPVVHSVPPSARRWAAVVLGGLTIWTVLLIFVPAVRFKIHMGNAQLGIEGVGLAVLALTCVLVYIRYSLGSSRAVLLVAVSFTVFAANQLIGLLIGPQYHLIGPELQVYFWSVGRFVAGLFLLGAVTSTPPEGEHPNPLGDYIVVSLLSVSELVVFQTLLYAFRDRLPPLSSAPFSAVISAKGPAPGLTDADFALGIAGAFLALVTVALLLTPKRGGAIQFPWLVPALILAAFSHIHYMLIPTIYTTYVSSADLLRLAFYGVLLVGLVWEINRVYHSERERAQKLSLAYQVERLRVGELEQLDRAKADLFSILTHELMHPVSSIRGFALTLALKWDLLDEETRRSMVQRMELESVRLRELAEGAISAANLEHQGFPMVKRPESVIELLREAAELVGELDGRLKLTVDSGMEHVSAEADRARILQVFRNLLSNAVKYSDHGTLVELHVGGSDGEILFSVTNEGPGITPEDVPRLFQRFSRARPAGKEDAAGSGLGLYIARRIVEDHGGRIWVDSEPGAQTTFSFTLPVVDGGAAG